MKVRRIACVLGLFALPSACAERATQSAAPASSPDNAGQSAPAPAEPAPPPAAAPAPQGLDQPKSAEARGRDEDFTTLEAAEHALNQAKSDLDRLALADSSSSPGRAAPADGVGKAEKKDARRVQAPSVAGAAASTPPSAVCENACRAFASLSRAANAVCRLDGDNGTHCTRAKRMVADSEPRVASCACIPAE